MDTKQDKKSFWTSIPGIITAVAAIIGSITALLGAIQGLSTQDTINHPPEANAGFNTTTVEGAGEFSLTGSGKDQDGDRLRFLWRHVSGQPAVKINEEDKPITTFIVPSNLTNDTQLRFQLTVSDDKGEQDKKNKVVTVLNNRTNDVGLLASEGWDLFHLARPQEAIHYFNIALSISPNNATIMNDIGYVLMSMQRYGEAIDEFDKAIEADPSYFAPVRNRIEAIILMNEMSINIKDVDLKNNDTALLNAKGVYLGKLGDYEEAIKYYDKALTINPYDSTILMNKGFSLNRLGNFEDGLKYNNMSLEINPNAPYAWNSKGNSLFGLGIYEEAIKWYDKVISVISEYPDLGAISLNNKGSSLYQMGKYQEAIEFFDKSLSINPSDGYVLGQRQLAIDALNTEREQVS